jgi:hypothetical protein
MDGMPDAIVQMQKAPVTCFAEHLRQLGNTWAVGNAKRKANIVLLHYTTHQQQKSNNA